MATSSACSSGSAPRAPCVTTASDASEAASATIAERAVHMASGRPVSEKTRTLRAEVATATKRKPCATAVASSPGGSCASQSELPAHEPKLQYQRSDGRPSAAAAAKTAPPSSSAASPERCGSCLPGIERPFSASAKLTSTMHSPPSPSRELIEPTRLNARKRRPLCHGVAPG